MQQALASQALAHGQSGCAQPYAARFYRANVKTAPPVQFAELYNRFMKRREPLLKALGGEAGCVQLSTEFYARVGKDPTLRRLFPGKSLRCATEAFGAFLIQFLGGDEVQTQARWWLSLRESHALPD